MVTVQSQDAVLTAINQVFRTYGYEGATISIIAAATGLKRSSLYHRFPGGKADMASAVLAAACNTLKTEVFAPLQTGRSLQLRVREMLKRLRQYYADGRLSCLLETLSVGGDAEPELQAIVADAYAAMLQAFVAIAAESGQSKKQCKASAEKVMVLLQGALVVARISKDETVFPRAVDDIGQLLLA